jgi:hypothetical protein
MAKIQKHAEFMDTLHSMITKEATAGKATGKPGHDTHYTSVSKETEHVDKNKEGKPEHNPQEFKQEKSTDASDPTKTHKEAGTPEENSYLAHKHEVIEKAMGKPEAKNEIKVEEKKAEKTPHHLPDTASPAMAKQEAHTEIKQYAGKNKEASEKLAELGSQLLAAISEMNKQATAGEASGKPGHDTHYTSVSKETEHVDKNKEGKPEHNPQEFKQEKSTDASDPTKTHKSANELELDKEASFELGRQFARAFLSTKVASETNIYKEAGRRDFEALIATAAAELEKEEAMAKKQEAAEPAKTEQPEHKTASEYAEYQIKQAEEAGAQAFYDLLKQANEEQQANQVKLAYEQRYAQVEQRYAQGYAQVLNEKQAIEKYAQQLSHKLASQEAAMQKQAEEAALDNKFAQWGGRVVDEVISRLKHSAE